MCNTTLLRLHKNTQSAVTHLSMDKKQEPQSPSIGSIVNTQTNGAIDFSVVSFSIVCKCLISIDLLAPIHTFYLFFVFLSFRAILAAHFLFGDFFNKHVECLNVTCSNQIGFHPFQRINTCYVKQMERPLEPGEQITFQLSYAAPDQIKTLDISIANPNQPSFGIDHIPIEAFRWFPNLQSLRVNSHIVAIQSHELDLAQNLTELIVSDQLETIECGIFPSNNKLAFLSFESNRISTIQPFAFEQLKHLFSLKLQKNQLKAIQRNAFAGLQSLHVLNLNQNDIGAIEMGAFDGLNHLQFLQLQQNRLENLYDSIFHGLPNLIDLCLSKNRLHHINKSLRTLMNLKKIDLNYNQIVDLKLRDFAEFPSLVDLRLINCGFSFKNPGGVPSMTTTRTIPSSVLEYLYLDNNNLSDSRELQALRIFGELKELSLDDNLYKTFDLGGKQIKEICPKLQFLSLEGNDIDQNALKSIYDTLNTQNHTMNPM